MNHFLAKNRKRPLAKTKIRTVSNKQAAIKRKLNAVYKEIDSEREPVCQGCGRNHRPLSHSHTISQKRCKEIGKPELIWDKDNIELECFGASNGCHEVWESKDIARQILSFNFNRRMAYIKLHDTEMFNTMNEKFKGFRKELLG